MNHSFTGKTALVTGCKRGLGKAMALRMALAAKAVTGLATALHSEPNGEDACSTR